MISLRLGLAPFLLGASCALAETDTEWLRSINGASAILADAAVGKKKTDGFFGSVALGYLANSGNTDSTNLNAKTALGYLAAPWRHALMLRALKGTTGDALTAKEYEAIEQTDYIFADDHYVFGALSYSANEFSGYERRTSEVMGYGRRLLDNDAHTLDLQAGAGARQTRLSDGTREEGGVVQLAGGYVWNFSETAKFSQQGRIEYGETNTYSESVSAVTSTLQGDFALSLTYTVKHNSDVPAGRARTDRSTAISLIYEL